MELKSNTYVIILAAGFATRLRPISDKIPKPLIQINGKTIISRIISNFKKAGFNRFCIVLSYKKELIKKEILKDKDLETLFIDQPEPTGMADAIAIAINSITKIYKNIVNFFITAADIIFPEEKLLKMYELHNHTDVVLSLMKSNDLEIAKGHANVEISEDSDLDKEFDANQGLRIIGIIEKPKSHEIISEYYSLPLYLINQEIIKYMKNIEISERGEREFQEVLKNALLNNLDIRGLRIVSPLITADNIGEFHLTFLRDIIKMNKKFLLGTKLMQFRGELPKLIEPVSIGNGIWFGDKVTLGPYVIVGNACKIGDFCELSNTILSNKVELGKSCELEYCIIDEGIHLQDNYRAKDCFITRKNKKDLEIINF